MALKNLTVEEMVVLSVDWVGAENAAHQVLKQHARLGALLPDLERAHASIYSVTPQAVDPRKAELAQQAIELDARHDQLARGVYGVLTEFANLVNEGAEYISLRNELFPNGISSVIHGSFRTQAGYADLLRSRLTAEQEQRLQAFVLPKTTLLEKVTEWLDTGRKLGELEGQRARLETADGPSFGQQTIEARNLWIRVVNAFVSLAGLAVLDPKHDLVLFGPLREAEARADARVQKRKSAKEPQPAVAPEVAPAHASARAPELTPAE